jgi:putative membrane protein insertion efficiency factor
MNNYGVLLAKILPRSIKGPAGFLCEFMRSSGEKTVVLAIRIYRGLISPFLGNNCRFYPSCSCYAETAIKNHGVITGSWMAARRLARCHPWHPGGIDLVPDSLPVKKVDKTS